MAFDMHTASLSRKRIGTEGTSQRQPIERHTSPIAIYEHRKTLDSLIRP